MVLWCVHGFIDHVVCLHAVYLYGYVLGTLQIRFITMWYWGSVIKYNVRGQVIQFESVRSMIQLLMHAHMHTRTHACTHTHTHTHTQ